MLVLWPAVTGCRRVEGRGDEEALVLYRRRDRGEAALARDGYPLISVRGCWVVDAACNDGFCPADDLPSEVRGGLLFSNVVYYGTFRERTTESDYSY